MKTSKEDVHKLAFFSLDILPQTSILPSFEVKCSFHPSLPIIKICKQCYLKNNFLLCEKCLSLKDPNSHNEHAKSVVCIDKYIEECLNNWDHIQNEEKEVKEMFSKLEEFIEEASKEEKVLESFIDQEIQIINQDFEILIKKFDEIRENLLKTKKNFIKTLTDEIKETRKLKEDLEAFAEEGSPFFKKKSISVGLEESINKLKNMKQDKEIMEKDDIIETFRKLVKEFKKFESNFELNYKKDYIEEIRRDMKGQQITKKEASGQIMNIIHEIRNKSKYPPKYKQFQNSKEEFDNFLKSLEQILEEAKGLSEKLLLTQHEITYKFTGENLPGKATFSSDNISLRLTSERVSRLPETFEIATAIKTDHKKGITCLCVYDQQCFITGGNDSLIKLWDLYTFKCSKNLKCETVPYSIITLIDSDGEKVLISGHAQGYVAVFNHDFDLRWVFKRQESIISSLISTNDRRTVFSASYDATILIIDIVDGHVIKKLSDHEGSVNCLGYSSSLNKLASGSDDGKIIIWDIEKDPTKKEMEFLKEKTPNLEFSEDLIRGSLDSIESDHFSEKFSEEETGEKKEVEKENKNLEENEENLQETSFRGIQAGGALNNGEEVKHIVFSQNNPRILISTCYNLIKVWDIQTKSCLLRLGKHEKIINRILIIEEKNLKRFDHDQKRTRAESLYNTNFETQNGNNLLELMCIDKLMILSFGIDHMIRLWDAAKNACVCESHDHIKEFSLKDSLESTILMYNEKDDKVYFLSVGDKDNNINIWKLK